MTQKTSTGDYSTGDYSTGYCSTGHCSTGNRSTGHWSTGHWSISNRSTGHFCTIDYMGFSAFNKPITPEQRAQAYKPSWLYFDITEWVAEENMTEKEKQDNPSYKTTWGFLKVYSYKEARKRAYDKATREEQLAVTKLPNFDADIFFEISWIRVEDEATEMTVAKVCAALGKNIKIVK